jgi:hypothetical protein
MISRSVNSKSYTKFRLAATLRCTAEERIDKNHEFEGQKCRESPRGAAAPKDPPQCLRSLAGKANCMRYLAEPTGLKEGDCGMN